MQPQNAKKIKIIAWLVPAIFLFLYAALAFHEWFQLKIIADPKVIAQYPFGSEGPVAGNPAYASLDAYIRSNLIGWVMYSLFATTLIIAGRRSSRKLLRVTWLLLGCFIAARYFYVL